MHIDSRTRNTTQSPEGFSLLAMMAVLSFFPILASFSMPIYRTMIIRAREVKLREELFTVRAQIDRFRCGGLSEQRLWPASPPRLHARQDRLHLPPRPPGRSHQVIARGGASRFEVLVVDDEVAMPYPLSPDKYLPAGIVR